jgi:hypothetical protein
MLAHCLTSRSTGRAISLILIFDALCAPVISGIMPLLYN